MSVLILVNSAPYGSEGPHNALRLAEALVLRGEHADVFLMGDAAGAARAGQDLRGARVSLEAAILQLLDNGVGFRCCGTCCAARGIREEDLIHGVQMNTIHDLAATVALSDKVISF